MRVRDICFKSQMLNDKILMIINNIINYYKNNYNYYKTYQFKYLAPKNEPKEKTSRNRNSKRLEVSGPGQF